MNQSTPQEVDLLQFINAELNTTTRHHSGGNNIFTMMHWCHKQFKEYTYQQQRKELSIQHTNVYTNLNYRQHKLQPRRQQEPVYNYSIIHRVGTIIWRGLSPAMTQAWKDVFP
jgi:hypothetical protein